MTGAVRKTDQYALIGLLIERAKKAKKTLGKKALQKTIHLIQEIGDVEAGYRFSFYTYGPYSSRLSGDLDAMANNGGAAVSYNRSRNYYLIETGERTRIVVERGRKFLEENRESIERVLSAFGGRLAKELELTSTIVYLRRYIPEDEFGDDERLRKRVKVLKPRYSDEQVDEAIAEVRDFLARETNRRAHGRDES